ncbi:unnamed protein product [Pocillopora meandrina]|uniref:Uncharacterized protein n=1 Tax=Pocillopora meandrina TaxID=46732 RepID=A0AAU9WXQ0_9CNID|nr:unnamed protein product [Pocillopora meandrina]
MRAVFVKSFSSLFTLMLITPSVLARSLHSSQNKGDCRSLKMRHNAGNHAKKCYPGYPRKQASYLPYRICYRRFFVGMKPPEGLRRSNSHNPNIRYICQRPEEKRKSQYGTMFDESLGLAVFSAYTLTAKDVDFQNRAHPASWAKTPGIENQGSDAIYPSLPYIRGQLVPALTLSNTGKGDEGWLSTFTYTNAVPQRPDFNMGEWFEFENKIRSYARDDCIPNRGKLYLLTGTSFVHSEPDWPIWPRDPKRQPWLANIKDNYLIPDSPPIAIPVSLWTAGCCIDSKNGTVTGNFAVIGNNEEDNQLMHTRQISVEQLQSILKQDVKANENSNRVKLFPAIRDCSKESKQITLPWA